MAGWGLENRLARIIKPHDRRGLMLAVDHGYFLGPTERLESPGKVVAPLLKYCDSLMLTRGVQRACVPANTGTPMVLRVSGGPSIIGGDLSREDVTVSVEDAIRLNASAVAMSIFVGSKYEHQTVANLGRLVNEAERYGMPVLAVTAVGKELGKDARYLSLACRVAAEQGAHVVKTYYCEGFEKVVQSCPVPIIVAGGKKIPEKDALELTYNSVQGGAAGVDMGRNIWQSDHPVAMIRAVGSIVHGSRDARQAYSLYEHLVAGSKKGKPGGEKRVVDKPGGEKRVVDKPGGEKRVVDKPGGEKRVVDKPGGEKRVVDKPGGEKRVVDKPGGEKRVVDKPGGEKRVVDKPGGEKRVVDKPGQKEQPQATTA